ncbi:MULTISPECIES: hypothetical protein [Flagellimonas]|uniref:Pectinesterase inhibitor domain-containing protein n=1 Tax=Flagellimonas hadalis TaxID=2597517 RepID=A0A5N5IWV5_9FLAO|nr:hypothetical protein [Allomuricauda hadalis]KAB5491603.1 hypothetical protein FOT42_001250 [Allomuricauda hadalis]
MAPKSRVLVVLAFFLAIQATYPNQCDNFYSKVTYALNHCKKAMTATNFEHQMYYAERAWEALENAKSFMDECDCAKTEDKTIDAMETLDKAIEPADWEAGRFFTKKGMAEITELITFIDQCTLGVSTTTVAVDDEATPSVVQENGGANSMELEMIKVFEKHASDKLQSAEQAIQNLVELSKTIGTTPEDGNNDPNSLSAHQKAYLDKAKKLLETGLKNMGGE